MDVTLSPGKYVVAVSGGVDSVVLLDVLSKQSGLELVVAHFDHGMREESAKDAAFVRDVAQHYNLPFETEHKKLGVNASEAQARTVRYHFLRSVQKKHKAAAIITAHHQDDVIETLILSVLRGSYRKGLSSLQSHSHLLRPLLHIAKQDIIAYAKDHNLQWREDETNADTRYARNYVRHAVMPRLTVQQRRQLLQLYNNALLRNKEIDRLISQLVPTGKALLRYDLVRLPFIVQCEVVRLFIADYVSDLSRRQLWDIVTFCKTAKPDSRYDLSKSHWLVAGTRQLKRSKK